MAARDREGVGIQQLVNRATHDIARDFEPLECHLGGSQIRITVAKAAEPPAEVANGSPIVVAVTVVNGKMG